MSTTDLSSLPKPSAEASDVRAPALTLATGSEIRASDIVRPIGDDLRNAFFRVLSVTRNGWATCVCVAYADGQRPMQFRDYSHTPKFRTRELKRVDSLPPDPNDKEVIDFVYGHSKDDSSPNTETSGRRSAPATG